MRLIYLILFVMAFGASLHANEAYKSIPVAYKGRYIPLEVYAKHTLQEFYGKQQIKKEHLEKFNLEDRSALTFFLNYYFDGHERFDNSPLFSIHHAELKKILGLKLKEMHFSYNELKPVIQLLQIENASKPIQNEALNLLNLLNQYKNWNGTGKSDAIEIQDLTKSLNEAGSLFKALPLKRSGDFVSLDALQLQVLDAKTGVKKDIGNFTSYSDADYQAIKSAYKHPDRAKAIKQLGKVLNRAYTNLEGTPSQQAFQKTTFYPTKYQLQAELFYYQYPLVLCTIALYGIALIGLILNQSKKYAISFLVLGFILHTFILGLRCFILSRPPVSNMFETVIYVPWIAMVASFIFYTRYKNRLLLIASTLSTFFLLILLELTGMNNSLENVQAVLDSEYWLIVHVLMIVGSYGVFFLSGVLGFIYLTQCYLKKQETPEMKLLVKCILQTMYLGVLMLIPGTILGGVWAAESWGRFWDWDPKESWAFISSCIYLIFIHGYRFHKIGSFGLSVGSIIGLLAISFTWYGVNYILGTGLHSYGFGSGGEIYYYVFLLSVLIFLIIVSFKRKNIVELKNKNVL